MSCSSLICGKIAFSLRPLGKTVRPYAGPVKKTCVRIFYVRGDEEGALKWRPGRANDCWWRNCKIYSWESFEEEYHENYIQDMKTEKFVSSDESD